MNLDGIVILAKSSGKVPSSPQINAKKVTQRVAFLFFRNVSKACFSKHEGKTKSGCEADCFLHCDSGTEGPMSGANNPFDSFKTTLNFLLSYNRPEGPMSEANNSVQSAETNNKLL